MGVAVFCARADTPSLVTDGRAYLAAHDLTSAKAKFAEAVAQSSNDPTANFFFAVARVFELSRSPEANVLLNRLGFDAAGRTIYSWTSEPARDANGKIIAPSVSASEVGSFIHNTLLPQIVGASTNLAVVASPRFLVELTRNETGIADVTIDYADVLMLRAQLHAASLLLYSITSWNADVQLDALSDWLRNHTTTLEGFLTSHPDWLKTASDADLSAARTAFLLGISEYLEASAMIAARSVDETRLFNADPEQADAEKNFQFTLQDLRDSLDKPVVLRVDPKRVVEVGAFFQPAQNPRRYLPQVSGDAIVAGTLPDQTFGGVIFGIGDQMIEHFVAREGVRVAPRFAAFGLSSDGQLSASLGIAAGKKILIETSSDLRTWTMLTNHFSFSDSSFGFRGTFVDQGLPMFFRASSANLSPRGSFAPFSLENIMLSLMFQGNSGSVSFFPWGGYSGSLGGAFVFGNYISQVDGNTWWVQGATDAKDSWRFDFNSTGAGSFSFTQSGKPPISGQFVVSNGAG
jgi:hypothetical protein